MELLEAKKLLFNTLDDRNKGGSILSDSDMKILIGLCGDPDIAMIATTKDKKAKNTEIVDTVTQAIVENTGGITSAIIEAIRRNARRA